MIVGESAGLEDDGAQLGDAAATTQNGELGVRYKNTVLGDLLKVLPRRRFAAIVERHKKRCIFRSRRRTTWCEFSARLFIRSPCS